MTNTAAPSSYTTAINVVATRISEDEVSVAVVASGYVFLNVILAKDVVEDWIRRDMIAAEMMQIFVNAHPANEVVRQLVPLLPVLTTLDPKAVNALSVFKENVRDLVGKHSQQLA